MAINLVLYIVRVKQPLKQTIVNSLHCLCKNKDAHRVTIDAREDIKVARGASIVGSRQRTVSWAKKKRTAVLIEQLLVEYHGCSWILEGRLWRLKSPVCFPVCQCSQPLSSKACPSSLHGQPYTMYSQPCLGWIDLGLLGTVLFIIFLL